MATKSRARESAEAPITIRARREGKKPITKFVPAGKEPVICRMAREWGYILRVRTRWAGDPDMRDYFSEKATNDLKHLGIRPRTIQEFASVGHIEVELRDLGLKTKDGTALLLDVASEIPWEYLLSSVTQKAGRFNSLLVTRCLANRSSEPPRPKNFLFVESAPGRIAQIYRFDDEEKRLSAAVNLKENQGPTFSKTEPFTKLQDKIRKTAWDAVHVTGVDTHQAGWLIEDFYSAVARSDQVIDKLDRLHDGMILRGDHDSELPVRYNELADLLLGTEKPSKTAPGVISLNLYYSGARTARELVERGVYAALGFLDEINDEFAELFFQAFYWAWYHNGKKIPQAFLDAWSAMDGERMHGTSIVIWLGRSMVDDSGTSAGEPAPAKTARPGGR